MIYDKCDVIKCNWVTVERFEKKSFCLLFFQCVIGIYTTSSGCEKNNKVSKKIYFGEKEKKKVCLDL